jgi:hypothetical protein
MPLRDNVKARQLQPDGSYLRVTRPGPALRSQTALLEAARARPTPAERQPGDDEPRVVPLN